MKRLLVRAEIGQLPAVLRFVEDALTAAGCPKKARFQLALAAEEAFVNIARYAYGAGGGEVDVTLAVSGDPPLATLTFADRGVPHNPLQTPAPATALPAERREIGGLGVHLMRRSMDDARYRYAHGRNVLTLVKTFDRPPGPS